MTQEEKAKAYDEALKQIKECTPDENGFITIYPQEIFPELQESEDEKIKNKVIKLVKMSSEVGGFALHKWEADEMLAWLEKQGGVSKLSEEEQNKFAKTVLTSCASSFIDYLDAHKYEGKMCVSNGECEDIENAFHNAMWDRLHRYYCKYITKQGEKKPTLRERYKNIAKSEWFKKTHEELSVSDEEPKWSEEDEETINWLCRFLEKFGSEFYGGNEKNVINWLKSLGTQKQFKPTIIWHDVSEKPDEMREILVEWESDDTTWHTVGFYDAGTDKFREYKMPIDNVVRWMYVDELLEKQRMEEQQ